MSRNHPVILSLCASLLWGAAFLPAPLAAQTEPGDETSTGGLEEGPLPADQETNVDPPTSPDGLPEGNPVNEQFLLDLAAEYGPNGATVSEGGLGSVAAAQTLNAVFSKYAFLPTCCVGGIDHLAAGTGLRNSGSGTIRLRGVPPTATAVSAFLYFGFMQPAPPPNPLPVNFNGFAVSAFRVNSAPSPCWPGGTFWAYRAPVLPFLAATINADYVVRGVPSNLTNGQCPWGPINSTAPLAEGASLVVLYTDPSVPFGTQVQIHHPIVTQVAGTTTYLHFLNLPIQTAAVKHTRLGADGQVGVTCTGNINAGTNERTFIAGIMGSPFVQIRGNGSYANGCEDSDWNGTDGEPLNQLWDTHTMLIPNVINPGPLVTHYQVRYQAGIDCIVPVAHVLTYR